MSTETVLSRALKVVNCVGGAVDDLPADVVNGLNAGGKEALNSLNNLEDTIKKQTDTPLNGLHMWANASIAD